MRTAAIVGTASVVSGSVAHHQSQKYASQDAQAAAAAPQEAAPQEVVYAAPPPPPPPAENDDMAELTQLAKLHDQGILTDEEFSAKKAQILGI
ncbi:MAG TPA: SHOCT domain-containing protein [Acidimicrobiales bacterium]